jgi:FkbM family methyltransferase
MFTALLRLYRCVRPFVPARIRARMITQFAHFRARAMGKFATAVLTVGYNGTLLVPSQDMSVGWNLADSGAWDEDRIEFLKSRVRPESEVLIVGAHVGALLVPLAKVAARVVGIEPNPETFHLLEMNVKLNGLTNVELCNFAAGDRSGEVDFLVAEANSGASRLRFSHVSDLTGWDASSWAPTTPSKLRVPMRSLDDAFSGRTFDLVIMDIEGAEFAALSGMAGVLRRAETLQVEILPLYLKTIAMTGTVEAVKRLGSGFGSAIFMFPEGKSVELPNVQFDQLAMEIDRIGGGDVIFLRRPSNAGAA